MVGVQSVGNLAENNFGIIFRHEAGALCVSAPKDNCVHDVFTRWVLHEAGLSAVFSFGHFG